MLEFKASTLLQFSSNLRMMLILGAVVAAEVMTRRAVLSPGHLQLVWAPVRDHVILRVEARTQGYFALSFGSVHGGPGAQDAVLGWTSDAEVLLQDGVVGRDGKIASDRVNDYELLEGARNETFLSITLQRRWSTCDELEDLPLGAGSVLVSWALYPRPPDGLDTFPRLEDGERHGNQVIVFNAPPTPPAPSAGLQVWPLIMQQVRLASNSTALRWCALFQAPEMRDRHWIVGYRAEVRRAEAVKQMLVFECRSEVAEGTLSPGRAGRPCTDPARVPPSCRSLVLVWTPGNDVNIFPNDIGIPIGADHGGTDYYMLQILYSLPDLSSDGTDSSGLQVLLTSKKPRRQAAILEVGVRTQPLMALPPRQPAVTARGWCLEQCLTKALPRSGVTLVSVLLHAQSAARRVMLRHLQGTAELTPLVMDLGYQSDQQEVRILDPRIRLKPGDNVALECQYNTQDRDRTTLGGLGADDEMCLAYLLYYPRTSLASCLSQQSTKILDLLGIKPQVISAAGKPNHDKIFEATVSGKQFSLRDGLQSVDWGSNNMSTRIDAVQKELINKINIPYCLNAFGDKMAINPGGFLLYQEHLVPMSKVTRCGVWDKALRQERQRSSASKFIVSTFIPFVLVHFI